MRKTKKCTCTYAEEELQQFVIYTYDYLIEEGWMEKVGSEWEFALR